MQRNRKWFIILCMVSHLHMMPKICSLFYPQDIPRNKNDYSTGDNATLVIIIITDMDKIKY